MSTRRFEESLAFVLRWEGSTFTNDPADHGGATRYGVTQREYDAYRERRGELQRSVRFITMDEVRDIYRREYWERVQADNMPVPLDITMFDTGVLMGVGRAIRLLQMSLGVGVDGVIGPETREALSRADAYPVADRYTDLREARLRGIVERDPTQERFLRGWLNRLNDLRRTIARPDPHGHLSDTDSEWELNPEEGAPVGRATMDLPGDFEEEYASSEEASAKPYFLKTMGVAGFLDSTAALLSRARNPIYVVDGSRRNQGVLRLATDASNPYWFDIPLMAVDSITPLSLIVGDPSRVIASVSFRPEFKSFAATIERLSSQANRNGSRISGAAINSVISGQSPQNIAAYHITTADEDPARPSAEDLAADPAIDFELARTLTNYGAVEPNTSQPPLLPMVEAEAGIFRVETTRDFLGRTIPLDIDLVRDFLDSCMESSPRVRYGFGKKVPFHGATPGRDFTKVDCSGFIREAIWRATTPHLNFPDGSVVQHDWVRAQGFSRSTVADARLNDGAIRIAFLSPHDSESHIGHVAIIHNARTVESHGSVGPNSRGWTGTGWQASTSVYFLTAPTS